MLNGAVKKRINIQRKRREQAPALQYVRKGIVGRGGAPRSESIMLMLASRKHKPQLNYSRRNSCVYESARINMRFFTAPSLSKKGAVSSVLRQCSCMIKPMCFWQRRCMWAAHHIHAHRLRCNTPRSAVSVSLWQPFWAECDPARSARQDGGYIPAPGNRQCQACPYHAW